MESLNNNDTSLSLHSLYVVQLREHALCLVWRGYQQMQIADFVDSDEDEITGELVRHMKWVIEQDDAPEWAWLYSVNEQIRDNPKGVLGKRRPIVDVEFERHKPGRKPRLRFEAKRLSLTKTVGDYIGDEGLGSFLSGYYSRTHNEVGMLAYLQNETPEFWAGKLRPQLTSPQCRIATSGSWTHFPCSGPPHAYQTIHSDNEGVSLMVFHVLLPFSLS